MDNISDTLLRWNKLSPLTTTDNFAAKFQLRPAWARQCKNNNTVLGITSVASDEKPCNLLAVHTDLRHKYLHNEIRSGEYAPCDDNSIDPQFVIGTETYLSGLALAEKWKNIYPVLDSLFHKWPYICYAAAPDTRDRTLCDGTLYPPGDLTWLNLHLWEADNRWAA